MRVLRNLILNLIRHRHVERDLDDEVRSYAELLVDQDMATGMDETAARRAARLELGGVDQVKDAVRDVRRGAWLEHMWRDVRYGCRMLARSPGFTLVTITTLALGVGANLVIFCVADTLLLKPLAVSDPPRVIRAYTNASSNTSYADYLEYRDRNLTLSALAAFQLASVSLRTDGSPDHFFGMVVSGNYFEALGVHAAPGRAIAEADDRAGAPGVAMLSDGFWRSRFRGDPSVTGRAVTINGFPFTVVGVVPAAFTGTMAPIVPDVWVPWNAPGFALSAAEMGRRQGRSAHLIGRLRPGNTLQAAQADLATLASTLATSYPDTNRGKTMTVYPGGTLSADFGPGPEVFIAFLMAVVGLVLLIACLNIASLLLARSAARQRETATRLALGASRRRLVAQLLTESLLLSASGGLAAWGIFLAATRMLGALRLPFPVPVGLNLEVDWRVMAFAVVLVLATTFLFGLLPALQTSRRDVVPALKDGTATAGRERARLRAALLLAEIGMSTLLLVTAGLLIRSLGAARAIDRGFSDEHVLIASVDLETRGYSPERGLAFYERLLGRVSQSPGVVSATLVDIVPLTLSNQGRLMLKAGQEPPERINALQPISLNRVSPGHFQTLNIPLLAGRDFDTGDRNGTPDVAIVNETLARRFWPNQNPVGQRLREWQWQSGGSFGPWIRVIGVARDAKYATVEESPKPFMYRPLSQAYSPTATLLVKVNGSPWTALSTVSDQVHALDRDLPIFGANTLDAATSISLLPVEIATFLALALGGVAVLLAATGLYGVMSYLIRQRTKEIGIRMALGAQPASVIWLVTQQGLRWTASGIILGLLVSALVTRLLTQWLYGVRALDPIVFVGVPLLLASTAYAACALPGRRASRVDPMVALRTE
jgi:predicted permease